jgi:hypothetical protein
LRTFDRGAAHAGVVALNGFEILEQRPNPFGRAGGVDFVMNGRHGLLHK